MMKPFIGITCNYDSLDTIGTVTKLGMTGQDWNYVAGDYVYAVEEANAVPVFIPFCRNMDHLTPLLERLDGILISGGHDIDPNIYGKRPMPYCGRIVPERDAYDLAVARYAYEHKKPILGICRGIQILNVLMGGTIYQDMQKEGWNEHAPMGDIGPRNYPVHEVNFTPGSILHRVYGNSTRTNSFHHQAVHELGRNVTVTGRCEDGIVEGLEVSGGSAFTVGVQWHPEMMFDETEQKQLFRMFAEACTTA